MSVLLYFKTLKNGYLYTDYLETVDRLKTKFPDNADAIEQSSLRHLKHHAIEVRFNDVRHKFRELQIEFDKCHNDNVQFFYGFLNVINPLYHNFWHTYCYLIFKDTSEAIQTKLSCQVPMIEFDLNKFSGHTLTDVRLL